MRDALYYPHTQLRETAESERLLKRALLLWDRLEFITPDAYFRPHYTNRQFSEAVELIGYSHVPNSEEKQGVHDQLEELVTRPSLPDVFFYHGEADPYEIYPQKLSDDTWSLLQEARLAGKILEGSGDYPLSGQSGLVVMALLADECAGKTSSRVTDRSQSYASLTGLLKDDDVIDDEDTARERIVSTTLELLDVDQLSLQQMIDFRRREAAQSGTTLRDLRHRYVNRIEDHLQGLRGGDFSQTDVERKERQFKDDMKQDISGLSEALRLESTIAMLAKDVVVALSTPLVAMASAFLGAPFEIATVLTATSTPVTIAGILGTRTKYQQARSKIMREHAMAYLFELRRGVR